MPKKIKNILKIFLIVFANIATAVSLFLFKNNKDGQILVIFLYAMYLFALVAYRLEKTTYYDDYL
jgi:hypothetical protein